MNARTARLVLGFLAIFVLLSYAQRLAELAAALGDPAISDRAGNLLLFAATATGLSVATIALRRRMIRKQVARGLGTRIREAARKGPRVPALARHFHTSQDAIRAALGREATTPAAKPGSSFRKRQLAPPGKPVARAVVAGAKSYRALA